jgi:hypothetical protein
LAYTPVPSNPGLVSAMSTRPKDAIRQLEEALSNAFRDREYEAALRLNKSILEMKKENGARETSKHRRLAKLKRRNFERWARKYGVPPVPGNTIKIKIAADPKMTADLVEVLGTEFIIPVNGGSVSVNTSAGPYPLNVFVLYQLSLTALQRNGIVAVLKRHGIASPTAVCNSLTTRLGDDSLTLLEYLKAQRLLPESLLPLCDTIAQINMASSECRSIYMVNAALAGTGVKLTCEQHVETHHSDEVKTLVNAAFAAFLEHNSKNAADEKNFGEMLEAMQHLPPVDVMTEMIRKGSIHLTTHFDPVIPWLTRALGLWAGDKKTAFVKSFLGQVTDTGVGSICKPYHFLRSNFMGCVIDAANEHSGDGVAMMRAIIKMMDTRLRPGNYRVTETLNPETGEVKEQYRKGLVAVACALSGVTNVFPPAEKFGKDSVTVGTKKHNVGAVLAALVCPKVPPKSNSRGLNPGTFGGLSQSADLVFEDLPKTGPVCVDDIMEFLRKNPSATARVKMGDSHTLVGVGTVVDAKGDEIKGLFTQSDLIRYYNDECLGPELNIDPKNEWHKLHRITRFICNGKVNYVFTPIGAHPVGPLPNVMITEYLLDTKQTSYGPAISALSGLKMSIEHVVDPIIGYGIQTGTTPLDPGQRRKWFAFHSIPTIEITLNGVTRAFQMSPPQ